MSKDGLNFTEYKNCHFKINYKNNRRTVDSLQIRFGGHVRGNEDGFKNNIRHLNHSLRQLIFKKHKDGYYKKKFIFIEDSSTRMFQLAKGNLYFELYLFLEEQYHREFVTDYMKDFFSEIDNVYQNCSTDKIQFVPYNKRNDI